MSRERKASSERRTAHERRGPSESAARRARTLNGGTCDHTEGPRGCEPCGDESREYGAAGERILSWAKAIEILMEQMRRNGEDHPELCDAVDGLAFAIATIADHDIVNETLTPDDREVPLSGRYQGPRIVEAS